MLPPAAVVSMHNARSLAYDAGDIRSEISGKMGPFRAANARRIGVRSSAEPVAATASNASVSMAAMSAEPSISATGRPASMSGPIADLILAATATTLLPVAKACTACANAASAVRPRHRTRPFSASLSRLDSPVGPGKSTGLCSTAAAAAIASGALPLRARGIVPIRSSLADQSEALVLSNADWITEALTIADSPPPDGTTSITALRKRER